MIMVIIKEDITTNAGSKRAIMTGSSKESSSFSTGVCKTFFVVFFILSTILLVHGHESHHNHQHHHHHHHQQQQQPRGNSLRNDCPRKCMCFGNTVRCMFQKLTRIPKIPSNTTVLDLRFNEIDDIRPGTLHGLKRLDTLLLNDNQIRNLRENAFYGLPNLRILYLYKNRIESIAPGAFANLTHLEQLYLHQNRLVEIKRGTFSNLRKLERLFLHNNKLHRLPDDAFENVGPMTRLRLDSNALVCDCDLMWLVERLHDKPAEMAAVCQAPIEMQGKSLNAMSTSDFHCEKPKIMEGPEDVQVRIGETAIFNCRVAGSPKPKIKWMKDSGELNARDDDRFVVKEDGTLVISEITENDGGEYECIAQSKMGSTVSRKARAIITASPLIRFTQIPKSQTVYIGDEISLECVAEGVPTPELTWWRNNQRIQNSPRISLLEDGSKLQILSSELRDTARYICQASSVQGYAETSADVNVLSRDSSPPRLTYVPPETLEAEPGSSVEIPCRSQGVPKPAINWKKDGSALDSSRKFKISRGGSLYVYNVSNLDEGRYECTASNEHGRATAQSLLRVRQVLGARDNTFLVGRAFNDAKESVDRAINQTLASLFGETDPSTGENPSRARVDPFRLSRYPNAAARAAAKPAEIFERTLLNIRRYIEQGVSGSINGSFNYEELLTREQITEIERLSGCTGHREPRTCGNICFHGKYRTIDGSCNNLENPTWGSSYTGFRRILSPIYENGFSQPIGWNSRKLYHGFPKPAARLISTSLISTHDITSDDEITHMVMQWGQFLDHDLDHALPAVSSESWDGIDCKKSCENAAPCFPMTVPPGDPRVTNRRCIDFVRTSAVCGSGMTSVLWGNGLKPREQMNQLTSYLDASQVYGYDDALATDLRDFTPNRGLLREGAALPGRKAMLPYANGQFVDCRRNPLESSINCFVAGDIRANEQVGLLAMHTIWLREHNRIARILGRHNPRWSGDKIFQEARKIVGAEMQHITYEHWIPRIFGISSDEIMGPYRGYNSRLDASISNVFATAALRFGHSLIQPRLERLNESFGSIPQGPLSLRDAFFSPWRLVDEGGVDPLLRGMFATAAKLKLPEQNLNVELTEQLFRTAHAVALDLAAMNIQRSRDHAIPGYLEWRKFCNMSHVESFQDLKNEISSAKVREELSRLYGHPGNMDVWVGGILEDQMPGSKVGPLFRCLLVEQFQRTRDADRLWYENPKTFQPEQLREIKKTSLAAILCDNGDNITRIQKNVFLLPREDDPESGFVSCDEIPRVDLVPWTDCCKNCDEEANEDSNVANAIPRRRRDAHEKYLESWNISIPEKLETDDYSKKSLNSRTIDQIEQSINQMEEETKNLKKRTTRLIEAINELKYLLKDTKSGRKR